MGAMSDACVVLCVERHLGEPPESAVPLVPCMGGRPSKRFEILINTPVGRVWQIPRQVKGEAADVSGFRRRPPRTRCARPIGNVSFSTYNCIFVLCSCKALVADFSAIKLSVEKGVSRPIPIERAVSRHKVTSK